MQNDAKRGTIGLIALVQPDSADETQAAILAKVPPLNLFKGLLHSPALTALVAQLGGTILYVTKLDARVREAAILRLAYVTSCTYEVAHHRHISRDVGFTDADLSALESGDLAALDAGSRLAARWAEEAAHAGRASAETVRDAQERFGIEQTVELGLIVGYYTMLSQVLRSFEIPLEASPTAIDIDTRPAALDQL